MAVKLVTDDLQIWTGYLNDFNSNLQNNFYLINLKFEQIVKLINQQCLTIKPVVIKSVPPITALSLNRDFYLQIQHNFKLVVNKINKLLTIFNQLRYYGDDNLPAQTIKMVIPISLTITADSYNNCWHVLQQGLNKLQKIIEINDL